MIVASLFVLLSVVAVYVFTDLAVMRRACQPACRTCPHWEQCLSRRICRVEPARDPELCILRWS
jgi:hypothetical protein